MDLSSKKGVAVLAVILVLIALIAHFTGLAKSQTRNYEGQPLAAVTEQIYPAYLHEDGTLEFVSPTS